MLPWFLTYYATPVGNHMNTRTETVVSAQRLGIEILEVRHTSGIHAKIGDRVTVHYRFRSGEKVLVDSERLGTAFTFDLGDESVPDAIESGVMGLQLKGYRRSRIHPEALGESFRNRWPDLTGSVTFEITVIGLERPASP